MNRKAHDCESLPAREAVAHAIEILRAHPDLGREVFGVVLGELVEAMPEALALELGLGILARHRSALEVMARHDRAQRVGDGVAEA